MPIEFFFLMAIFTLILGYVIGNFFPVLNDKTDENINEDDHNEEPYPQPELPEQPEPDSSPSPVLLENARFFRHADSKKLAAQIDNQLLTQGDNLTSDQHALLSLLLLDLGEWVGIEGRIQAVEEIIAEKEELAEEDSPKPPGFSPLAMLKDAITADVYLPLADYSLADQINPFLQKMLEGSPLADRGISLMDIEGRGMVVGVGLDMYDTVDDVPDEEIRDLIKSAVAMWEKGVAGEE